MEHVLDPLSAFVTTHSYIAYGVLFLGVLWEGEITLIMTGILVYLGIFDPSIALSIAVIAAILKTVLGYRLGEYLGRAFPHSPILKYLERRILYFLPRFREQPFWSLVISKFIYGVNNAALLFAGYMKADFKKYCLAEGVSSVVWFGGMFALGLFFSSTALAISNNLRTFSFLLLLFILGFIVLLKIINLIIEVAEEWGLDKQAAKAEKNEF